MKSLTLTVCLNQAIKDSQPLYGAETDLPLSSKFEDLTDAMNTPFAFTAQNPTENALLAALSNFLAEPNPATLLSLQRNAMDLVPGDAPSAPRQAHPWRMIGGHSGTFAPFNEIRLVFDRHLSFAQMESVSGCLGYALREVLAGEELSEPTVFRFGDDQQSDVFHLDSPFTILCYRWRSDSSIRTTPDYSWAFELAAQYIREGTRLRETNRAGAGTRGTRLVEGIGADAGNIIFYVR